MARTGRFGRLPTQAPDLSSQIVSMLEQWQNAEDANILEAWTNGGRFHGRKVTDRMISNYYQKRRNSYDKDDPEYTEWDNELWQLRFQISNEKVMMAYKNQKIGPMAVARHLQAWARRMPKNSSYYRSLMASAGDFIKAAQAAKDAGSKAFDYQAMQAKINAQDRIISSGDRVVFAIDRYARQHGLIDGDQSILDPEAMNFWESETMDAVLDGAVQSDEWKAVVKSVERVFPGFSAQEPTYERFRDIVERQNRASREKIRVWKTAPSDYTYYISAERDAIATRKSSLVYLHGLDEKAKMAVIWDTWTGESSRGDGLNLSEGHSGATNPAEFLDGNPVALKNLRGRLRYFQSHGMDEEAQAAQLLVWVIEAGSADEATSSEALRQLRGTEATTTLFGGAFAAQGSALAWGNRQLEQQNQKEAIIAGDAVVLPNERMEEEAIISSFGGETGPAYNIMPLTPDPVTGLPRVPDESWAVKEVQLGEADGYASVGYAYQGKPVMDPVLGPTGKPAGYIWNVDNRPVYGIRTAEGNIRYGHVNPFETSGTPLTDDGDHYTIDYSHLEKTPTDPFQPTGITYFGEGVASLRKGLTGDINTITMEEDTQRLEAAVPDIRDRIEDLAGELNRPNEDIINDPVMRSEVLSIIDDAAAANPALGTGWRDRIMGGEDAMIASWLDNWRAGAEPAAQPDMGYQFMRENDPALSVRSDIDATIQARSDLASSTNYFDTFNTAIYVGDAQAAANRRPTGWDGAMRIDAMMAQNPDDFTRMASEWGNVITAGQMVPMADRLIQGGASAGIVSAGSYVGLEQAAIANDEKAQGLFAAATGFDAKTYQPSGEVTWPGMFTNTSTPVELRDPYANRAENILPSVPVPATMRPGVGGTGEHQLEVAANLKPMVGITGGKAMAPVNVKVADVPGWGGMPNFDPVKAMGFNPLKVNVGNVGGIHGISTRGISVPQDIRSPGAPPVTDEMRAEVVTGTGGAVGGVGR